MLKRPLHRVLLLTALIGLGSSPQASPSDAVPPAPDVVVFTIDYCPECLYAKDYLRQRGIAYREFNVEHSAKAKDIFERLGGRGVPFLLINGKPMHGFHPQQLERQWKALDQVPN